MEQSGWIFIFAPGWGASLPGIQCARVQNFYEAMPGKASGLVKLIEYGNNRQNSQEQTAWRDDFSGWVSLAGDTVISCVQSFHEAIPGKGFAPVMADPGIKTARGGTALAG